MQALLILAACCAAPMAIGAIAIVASLKHDSKPESPRIGLKSLGKRINIFRGLSRPAEERTK